MSAWHERGLVTSRRDDSARSSPSEPFDNATPRTIWRLPSDHCHHRRDRLRAAHRPDLRIKPLRGSNERLIAQRTNVHCGPNSAAACRDSRPPTEQRPRARTASVPERASAVIALLAGPSRCPLAQPQPARRLIHNTTAVSLGAERSGLVDASLSATRDLYSAAPPELVHRDHRSFLVGHRRRAEAPAHRTGTACGSADTPTSELIAERYAPAALENALVAVS